MTALSLTLGLACATGSLPPSASPSSANAPQQSATPVEPTTAHRGPDAEGPAGQEQDASSRYTDAQLALLNAFLRADTGRWRLDDPKDDTATASIISETGPSGRASMAISCVPARSLQISFVRAATRLKPTSIAIAFRDAAQAELRFDGQPAKHYAWHTDPPVYSGAPSAVVYHMYDGSQAVIDGMLLDGVSEMGARFHAHPDESGEYTFGVTGLFGVRQVLADYCHRTPAEVQATVVAGVLTAPTPTLVPSPTLTPIPIMTWQQEWCEERGNPQLELEGTWHSRSGVDGTTRLVMRCSSGLLIMGIHITRSDNIYPMNETGVALTVLHDGEIEFHQHYADRWEQIRGDEGGGLFIILPDAVAKDVVEAMYGPQFEDKQEAELLVLFDAVPGDVPGQGDEQGGRPDIVIPFR